jgi:SAM-dependent methyltransferase
MGDATMSWRKFLIVPRLVALSRGAPRDQGKAWDLFWSRVRRTGAGGDVLWDLGSDAEIQATLGRVRAHLDLSLPIVDLGSGNGRLTRALAGCFPRALGVDVSAAAVSRAREESRAVAGVDFRVVDMSRPGAGKALADELGPMNVHVRGVLHVMSPEAQRTAIENVRAILGGKGALYVVETDFHGDPLDHLEFQGASAGAIPEPLRLCIASGVRAPAHFSEREVDALFPRDRWERVAAGPAVLHTLPMHNRDGGAMDELSAYYAVLRAAE